MHHCLKVEEIVRNIADLHVSEGHKSHKSDVAHLAFSCRTLYEPAMDALWRELVSLKPLIRCLPEEVWDIENRVGLVIWVAHNY